MKRYSFTLQISGIDAEQDSYEDRLYDAGCDDALIAIINGTMFLDFDREAPSYDSAVNSAVGNVEEAGGHVVRVTRIES